jgi:Putative peptidoglycan binding domain
MKAFLALICSLGLVCIEPAVAGAKGQKKQQQNRAPQYTGQAPAYHGAVGGAGHVNVPANRSGSGGPTHNRPVKGSNHVKVPANRSPLTGKPTPAGKPTAVRKPTTVARQPGDKVDKLKTEPTSKGISRSASDKATIRSRTEPTTKTPQHQTLQTPTGSPIAGLPKWNFPTKSRRDLTLTPPRAVSTKAPGQNVLGAQHGIPSRLVTLAPMTPVSSAPFETKFGLHSITVPGANGVPPSGHLPGQTANPADPDRVVMPRIIPGQTGNPADPDRVVMPRIIPGQTGNPADPGQTHNPAGPDTVAMPQRAPGVTGAPFGDPANGTSTGQPVNMTNNPSQTNVSRNVVVNEQGSGERAPAGQFQQNRRIQGSDEWVDSDYDVFRNYRSEWHDRDWWRTHQSRIVYCVGGWYYWNEGYWFPAWGYDPDADYAYDGPIYAYKEWPPDQVTASVQGTLQRRGYYQGEPDGLLGSPTSSALVDYQRAHGLYETSTIDRPTSQSLGMK